MVLVKTNKEKLLHLLEQRQSPLEELPTVATWIYDGLAVFRSMNVATLPETFAELAKCIFSIVTRSLRSPKSRADFVINQYPDVSIKLLNEIDAPA